MKSRNTRIYGLLCIALLIKAIILINALSNPNVFKTSDSEAYYYAATSFLKTGDFLQRSDPVTFHIVDALKVPFPILEPLHHFSIGFPFYLALVFFIFGSGTFGQFMALFILMALGTIALPMLMRDLLRKMSASPFLQIAVALGVAYWPESFVMCTYGLSEQLTVVLLTLLVWFVAPMVFQRGSIRFIRGSLAGLTAGMLNLTRAEFTPVIFLIMMLPFIGYLLHRGNDHFPLPVMVNSFLPLFLIAIFAAIPIVRNYRAFGELIPFTSAGGKTLWLATIHSDSFGFSGPNRNVLIKCYVPGKPGATDKKFREIAMMNVIKRPAYYLEGMVRRFIGVNFSSFGEPAVRGRPVYVYMWRVLLRLSQLLMMVCFAFGLFIYRKKEPLFVLCVFFLYSYKYLFLHVVYNGVPRMFYPFYPLALVFAFLGAEAFVRGYRNKSWKSASP
jgi:hypothetical protein